MILLKLLFFLSVNEENQHIECMRTKIPLKNHMKVLFFASPFFFALDAVDQVMYERFLSDRR